MNKDLKFGLFQKGGFPTGNLVSILRAKGGQTTLSDIKDAILSDPVEARVKRFLAAVGNQIIITLEKIEEKAQ